MPVYNIDTITMIKEINKKLFSINSVTVWNTLLLLKLL